MNFTSIFPRVCGGEEDYYDWMPWDEVSVIHTYIHVLHTCITTCTCPVIIVTSQRLDGQECMLGSSITIERRKVDVCCLNGREYDREFNFEICLCAEEDFEW